MVAVRLRIAPHTVDLFDLFDNRTARASELMRWGEVQGWTLRQNPTGPPRWFDQDGVERLTVKRGSARTPGSEEPHASIRNESGKYLDATGLEAKRESLPSHIPILWDLP